MVMIKRFNRGEIGSIAADRLPNYTIITSGTDGGLTAIGSHASIPGLPVGETWTTTMMSYGSGLGGMLCGIAAPFSSLADISDLLPVNVYGHVSTSRLASWSDASLVFQAALDLGEQTIELNLSGLGTINVGQVDHRLGMLPTRLVDADERYIITRDSLAEYGPDRLMLVDDITSKFGEQSINVYFGDVDGNEYETRRLSPDRALIKVPGDDAPVYAYIYKRGPQSLPTLAEAKAEPADSCLVYIQSDTTDGDTTVVDSSAYNRTITNNSVVHSAETSLFGNTSLRFTPDSSLSIDASDDLFYTPGDFTLRLEFRSADGSTGRLWSFGTDHIDVNGHSSLSVYILGVNLVVYTNCDFTNWTSLTVARKQGSVDVSLNGTLCASLESESHLGDQSSPIVDITSHFVQDSPSAPNLLDDDMSPIYGADIRLHNDQPLDNNIIDSMSVYAGYTYWRYLYVYGKELQYDEWTLLDDIHVGSNNWYSTSTGLDYPVNYIRVTGSVNVYAIKIYSRGTQVPEVPMILGDAEGNSTGFNGWIENFQFNLEALTDDRGLSVSDVGYSHPKMSSMTEPVSSSHELRIQDAVRNLLYPIYNIITPTAIASSESSGYEASKVLDNDETTYWDASSTSATIDITDVANDSFVSDGYSIRVPTASNAPTDWVLQGYDGTSWHDLDTRANVTPWVDDEVKFFEFLESTDRIYKYRLNISAVNGGTSINISEIEFFYRGDVLKDDNFVSQTSTASNRSSLNGLRSGEWHISANDQWTVDLDPEALSIRSSILAVPSNTNPRLLVDNIAGANTRGQLVRVSGLTWSSPAVLTNEYGDPVYYRFVDSSNLTYDTVQGSLLARVDLKGNKINDIAVDTSTTETTFLAQDEVLRSTADDTSQTPYIDLSSYVTDISIDGTSVALINGRILHEEEVAAGAQGHVHTWKFVPSAFGDLQYTSYHRSGVGNYNSTFGVLLRNFVTNNVLLVVSLDTGVGHIVNDHMNDFGYTSASEGSCVVPTGDTYIFHLWGDQEAQTLHLRADLSTSVISTRHALPSNYDLLYRPIGYYNGHIRMLRNSEEHYYEISTDTYANTSINGYVDRFGRMTNADNAGTHVVVGDQYDPNHIKKYDTSTRVLSDVCAVPWGGTAMSITALGDDESYAYIWGGTDSSWGSGLQEDLWQIDRSTYVGIKLGTYVPPDTAVTGGALSAFGMFPGFIHQGRLILHGGFIEQNPGDCLHPIGPNVWGEFGLYTNDNQLGYTGIGTTYGPLDWNGERYIIISGGSDTAGGSGVQNTTLYNYNTNQFIYLQDCPIAHVDAAGGTYTDSSGRQKFIVWHSNTLYEYDIVDRAWSGPISVTNASGQTAVSKFAYSLDRTARRLYMYGGEDGSNNPTNQLCYIDLDTNTLTLLTTTGSAPGSLVYAVLGVSGDKVVLFGGNDGTNWLQATYELDLTVLDWATKTDTTLPALGAISYDRYDADPEPSSVVTPSVLMVDNTGAFWNLQITDATIHSVTIDGVMPVMGDHGLLTVDYNTIRGYSDTHMVVGLGDAANNELGVIYFENRPHTIEITYSQNVEISNIHLVDRKDPQGISTNDAADFTVEANDGIRWVPVVCANVALSETDLCLEFNKSVTASALRITCWYNGHEAIQSFYIHDIVTYGKVRYGLARVNNAISIKDFTLLEAPTPSEGSIINLPYYGVIETVGTVATTDKNYTLLDEYNYGIYLQGPASASSYPYYVRLITTDINNVVLGSAGVDHLDLLAHGDVKLAFSFDGRTSWYTYNSGWVSIDITDTTAFHTDGVSDVSVIPGSAFDPYLGGTVDLAVLLTSATSDDYPYFITLVFVSQDETDPGYRVVSPINKTISGLLAPNTSLLVRNMTDKSNSTDPHVVNVFDTKFAQHPLGNFVTQDKVNLIPSALHLDIPSDEVEYSWIYLDDNNPSPGPRHRLDDSSGGFLRSPTELLQFDAATNSFIARPCIEANNSTDSTRRGFGNHGIQYFTYNNGGTGDIEELDVASGSLRHPVSSSPWPFDLIGGNAGTMANNDYAWLAPGDVSNINWDNMLVRVDYNTLTPFVNRRCSYSPTYSNSGAASNTSNGYICSSDGSGLNTFTIYKLDFASDTGGFTVLANLDWTSRPTSTGTSIVGCSVPADTYGYFGTMVNIATTSTARSLIKLDYTTDTYSTLETARYDVVTGADLSCQARLSGIYTILLNYYLADERTLTLDLATDSTSFTAYIGTHYTIMRGSGAPSSGPNR